jgi:hypothetical protein
MRTAKRIGRLAGLLAVAVGFLLAGTGPVAAGPGDGTGGSGDRVEEALRRTDEALQRAREIVRETDSRRARELLERAAGLQDSAWKQHHGSHPVMAGRLTVEARRLALRAVALAKEDAALQSRARLEGERALRALQRARETFDGAPGPQAARRLEEARSQIERGRVQLHEQHYEAALRLTLSAQRLIKQALGSVAGEDGAAATRELERTDRLIERVLPVVRDSGDEEARRVLDSGMSLQNEAWEALRAGRLRMAYATTREARGLVNRAAALVRGPVDVDAVARALAETDRLLEQAADVVRDSRNERAIQLLERATEHQERASRFLGDERLRPALAETRVARSLAKRAMRMAQGETP